jgi:hypothetical protein
LQDYGPITYARYEGGLEEGEREKGEEGVLVIEVGKLINAGVEGIIAVMGFADFCVATFSMTFEPKIELE